MAESAIDARVAALVKGDAGILETFGMTVHRAAEGVCEIRAVVTETLVNAAGFGHGSIAFSIMDTAAAYAVASTGQRGVTVNANVTYLRPATGGMTLVGRAEMTSRSSRVASLNAETRDGDGALVAHGSFLFQLRSS